MQARLWLMKVVVTHIESSGPSMLFVVVLLLSVVRLMLLESGWGILKGKRRYCGVSLSQRKKAERDAPKARK